jgi:heme exporter protein D
MTDQQTRGLIKWLAWGMGSFLLLMLVLVVVTLLRPTETRQAIDARQMRERNAEQKRQNAEMEEFKKTFKQPGEPTYRDYRPVVTKADYDAIAPGMTYARVSGMIGSAGEELSRVDLAGHTTIMYSWKNANGSNMNAMFQNDRLVTKAQFGLQ